MADDNLSLWRQARFPFVLGVGLIVAATQIPRVEQIGDKLQYALPIAGAVCAFDKDELGEMAGRYFAGLASVHFFKNILPDSGINLRPDGGGNGFPSGHAYSAIYGASYMARSCAQRIPYIGPAVTVAGGFVAASRVEADKHTVWQVFWGTLFALAFDRLFQSRASRARRNAWFRDKWNRSKRLFKTGNIS